MGEDREEPVHEVDSGVHLQGFEVHADIGDVLLEEVLEELDSELDLVHVPLEEGQEVVLVHGVHEAAEGVVFAQVAGEDVGDLEEVADQADVRSDHS